MADSPVSEFNSAFATLNRLNAVFGLMVEASVTHDVHRWFDLLMAMKRELWTYMSVKERNDFSRRQQEINDTIGNPLRLHRGIPADLHAKLESFEIDLRMIFDRSGLGMKIKEDSARVLR